MEIGVHEVGQDREGTGRTSCLQVGQYLEGGEGGGGVEGEEGEGLTWFSLPSLWLMYCRNVPTASATTGPWPG